MSQTIQFQNQKMKLFLSSKGLITDEITENFLSFVGSLRKVSMITTASETHKEKNKNTVKLKAKLTALGFFVEFIDVEFEDPERLRQSEIIIINGGNPYYLLHHLRKSKTDKILQELIKNNTPVMGISSGLLVLTKDLQIIDLLTPEMNTIGLKDKTCLGQIDEVVIPHYDRFVKEGIISKSVIDEFELHSTSKLIRLGEYQCLKYIDNDFEVIGEFMEQ